MPETNQTNQTPGFVVTLKDVYDKQVEANEMYSERLRLLESRVAAMAVIITIVTAAIVAMAVKQLTGG